MQRLQFDSNWTSCCCSIEADVWYVIMAHMEDWLTNSCGERQGGGWMVGRGKACRIKSAATVSDRDLTAAAGSHQPSAKPQFCRVCTPPVTSSQLFTHRSQKFRTGLCVCLYVCVWKLERACVCTFAKWWYMSSSMCASVHQRVKDRLRACVCAWDFTLFSVCVCMCVHARDWARSQAFVCVCVRYYIAFACACVSCRPGFTLSES